MVERLAQDTEHLEDEMDALVTQMKSLTTYLSKDETSSIAWDDGKDNS